MTKHSGKARSWSRLDDVVLRKLHAQGRGVSYIATFMACCRKTVHAKAALLGLEFAQRSEWTAEEDAILKVRLPHERAEQLARQLGKTRCQVYRRAAALGIEKSAAFHERELARAQARTNPAMRASQFRKGHVPRNKGTKHPPGWSPGRMAETQFKKGQMSGQAQRNYVPVGTERISRDGYLERKVNDDLPLNARWKAVHRLVWEAAHGPIPPGHVVAFRSGRKTAIAEEITTDRLELISLVENMRRNTIHNRYPREVVQVIQLGGALKRKIRNRTKGQKA